MKVEELRVGNVIKIDGIISVVDQRTIFDFDTDGRKKEPVPLNKVALKKLGFKTNKDKSTLVINRRALVPIYIEFDLLYDVAYGSLSIGEDAPKKMLLDHNSVHSFQNLVYGLSFAELQYKES